MAVFNYISVSPNKSRLYRNLDGIATHHDVAAVALPILPEPTPFQRYRGYKVTYRRRSYQ